MARVAFTAPRVAGFKCPEGKAQAFLWDADSPGLGLRVTAAGRPAYVFQAVYLGQTVRITIGSPEAWSIPEAQKKARELQRLIDEGKDPREQKREAIAASAAKKRAELEAAEKDRLSAVTLEAVWSVYVEDRRQVWGERHYADHLKMAKRGGAVALRGVRKAPDGSRPRTVDGPLVPLLGLPLRSFTSDKVETWASEQAKSRPTYARLCWRCLKVFFNWCAEHPEFSKLLSSGNPAATKRAREALGKPGVKDDALQREQLTAWFGAVREIQNPVISACLQVSLLTGARPGEVLTLRWADVNTQWKGLTIRDKVEGERVIPLTPYVAHLLSTMPRRNEWVFPSFRNLSNSPAAIRRRRAKHARRGSVAPEGDMVQASASGHLADPSAAHRCACTVAGLDGLTLHGLRRSFASLTEWLEIPAGVVAQIQGHKPSATAEKHYKRRPLDLLRVHHERIEAWILEQAKVAFPAATERRSALEIVSAA